eukprot:jgi/Tetstr1/438683/TSEL_027233.t1
MAGAAGSSSSSTQLPSVLAAMALLVLGYINIRGTELPGLGSSFHASSDGMTRSARERRLTEQHGGHAGKATAHIYVRSRHGSQIYVPCGLKFKPPRKSPEHMTHAEFFDYYRDVHKAEAQRFNLTKIAGKGSYGIVAEAVDTWTGETVAIKKMIDVFLRRSDALRNLRELKLLRMMRSSEDIVGIRHVMLPSTPHTYNTIFFVMESMDNDLRQVVRLAKYLPPETFQVILYQMLRGLNYMHTAQVYHRDIKPSNILINADCKVKICDFSLARPVYNMSREMPSEWTGYVATRWYRPPEMSLVKYTRWTHAMDVWGIGCVFLEAVLGRPLFPGADAEEQLSFITNLLGTPPPAVLDKYPPKVQAVLRAMPEKAPQDVAALLPAVPPDALAVALRMLDLDPEARPTPGQLLADPYFADMTARASSRPRPGLISEHDFAFSDMRRSLTFEELRQMLFAEMLQYHPAKVAGAAGRRGAGLSVGRSKLARGATSQAQMKYALPARERAAVAM